MKIETIQPQSGIALKLLKNQFLRITDIYGEQVSDMYCAPLKNVSDGLSAGRTIDYNDTIFLTTGHFLYAHSGKKLLEIKNDTCGRHDILVTPCSLQMFQMVSGTSEFHPSCLGNLSQVLAPFGIIESQITSTFNVFMNVTVDDHGRIKVECPQSIKNSYIVFQACNDLIVGLTACSDEATNNGNCKHISFQLSDKIENLIN